MADMNIPTETPDSISNFGLPKAAQFGYNNISNDVTLNDLEMNANLVRNTINNVCTLAYVCPNY